MITVTDRIDLGNYEYINLDARYTDPNGNPFSSVSAAQTYHAGKMNELFIGLTVLVKESGWTEAKEYWVQPKGTTPETYGLVEKGAGTTDYAELDNKPTISDGGTQIPLTGNVKVTAAAATSEQSTGVEVTAENGEITMAFTLEKGDKGDPGRNAVNPYKGYFPAGAAKPTTGAAGDYLYAPNETDGTTTTIWRWDVTENNGAGAFVDSQVEVDVSDVNDFAGGVPLNLVAIDESELKNPTNEADSTKPVLANAKDVMSIKSSLGLEMKEDKVEVSASNFFDGYYIKPSDGSIGASSGTTPNGVLCVSVAGYKSVRFLGFRKAGNGNGGSAFGFASEALTSENITEYTLDTWEEYGNGATNNTAEEYVVPVPENATYFICTVRKTGGEVMTIDDFYCYLQNGEKLKDLIAPLLNHAIVREYPTTADSTIRLCDGIKKSSETSDLNAVVIKKANSTTKFSKAIFSGLEKLKEKNSVLNIKANATNDTYVIFLKKTLDSSATTLELSLSDLIEGGYLSDIHIKDNDVYEAPIKIKNNKEFLEEIPYDAVGFYVSYKTIDSNYERTPQFIKIAYSEDSEYNTVKENINELPKSSCFGLKYGSYRENGTLADTKKIVHTTPISYGEPFWIELHEDYVFVRMHLFDAQGNMVTYNERVYGTNTTANKWGGDYDLPQYHIRIEIKRKDGGDIDLNDSIVKKYVQINKLYNRVLPTTPNWNIFQQRAKLLKNVCWTAKNKIISMATGSTLSSYYFKRDSVNRGIPYSETAEFDKYVGMHVSLRTFLSALRNKRSVMYTEDIHPVTAKGYRNVSAYGFYYNGLYHLSSTFYGSVCTGLASYLIGLSDVVKTTHWKSNSSGMTCVYQGESNNYDDSALDSAIANIKPMMVILKSGHVMVVTDVYKDEFNNIAHIVITEETSPRVASTPYSLQEVKRLFRSWQLDDFLYLYEQSDEQWQYQLNTVSMYDEDLSIVQQTPADFTPKIVDIDPDIACYAGEYASFLTDAESQPQTIDGTTVLLNNDRLYFNVHRGGGYTHLQVFYETDNPATASPIAEYSLATDSENNPWVEESIKINNTLVYTEDDPTKEDWILFNMKKVNPLLGAGLYKVRLRNSDSTKTSGFSHFELVEVNLSYNNTTKQGSFSCNAEATPYLVRWEKLNGMMSNYHAYQISEETTFSRPETMTDSSTPQFVKIFVHGRYGTVVKRVLTSGNESNDYTSDDEN